MRDRQREETRRRLYLAALEVFRRDGVAHCRIDDIAQRAEVSRAAFYFHFPTKEDVLLDFLQESRAPVAKALAELPEQTPIDQVLSVIADAMASFWQQEASLLADVATVALRHTSVLHDRDAEPVHHATTARFAFAAARGELTEVLAPPVLADFFLCNCLAAMLAWGASPELPLEQVLRGVATMFLEGARRR